MKRSFIADSSSLTFFYPTEIRCEYENSNAQNNEFEGTLSIEYVDAK